MSTFPPRPAWVRISPRETDSLKCCYLTAVHARDTAAVRRHGSNRQPGCEWAGFEDLACIAGDVLTPTNSYMSLGQAGLLVILDALLVSKMWGANRREDVSQGPAATGKPGIGPASLTETGFAYLFSDAWNSNLREQSTILTSSMPAVPQPESIPPLCCWAKAQPWAASKPHLKWW
jgi:hypothetical protein